MKRTTKSLIALLVLVAMCVSFCVPTFAEVTEGEHEHTENVATGTACPEKHSETNCDYEVVAVITASCGRDGYTLAKCKACQKEFIFGVKLRPNDHDYVNNGEAVAPKCEKTDEGYTLIPGSQPVKCSICGDEKSVTIDATDDVHVWGDEYFVGNGDPCTPEEEGYYEKECTICGKVQRGEDVEKYPKHEWVLTGEEQLPVCINPGWTEFKCTHCGAIKRVDIAAERTEDEGHAWAEVTKENTKTPPTHLTTGLAVVPCTIKNCPATHEVVLDTIDHDWTLVKAKAATCTDKGWYDYYTCTCDKLSVKDGEDYKIVDAIPEIKALDHDKITNTVVGDCDTKTVITVTCSRCDFLETTDGDFVHTYGDEPDDKKAPTCATLGYEFYFCTLCGHTKTIPLANKDAEGNHLVDEDGERLYPCKPDTSNKMGYVAGSCTEDEYWYYNCLVCGEKCEEVVNKAPGHSMKTISERATCVSGSYEKIYCEECDYIELETSSEVTDPEYHADGEDGKGLYHVVTPATCDKDGQGIYYCQQCHKARTEPIPGGHDYEEVKVTDATCGTPKTIEYECSVCGDTYEEIIGNENGHAEELVLIDSEEASCTKAAWYKYGCPDCAVTVDGEIVYKYTEEKGGEDIMNHSMVGSVQIPNCKGQKAGTWYTCNVCGEYEYFVEDTSVEYDKFNPEHHYVDGVYGGEKQTITHENGTVSDYYIEGTCKIEGQYQYKCKFCAETYLVSANDGSGKGHDADKITKDPASIKPAVEKTCYSEGFTEGYKCAFCDYTVEPESTGYAEHDWKNDKEVPATCLDSGTEAGRTCQVAECGKKEGYAPIDALGHNFVNYIADGNANCTSVGTKTAKCERCDVTDTKAGDAVDADNHSFTNYVSNNDATCLEDGTETAKCDRCDATDTKADVDSKLGHLWIDAEGNEDKVEVHATCTTKGYIIYSCLRCTDKDRNEENDRQYIVSYEDALGHTYTTLEAVVATCVVEGLTEGEWCPVCKEVFTEQTNLGLRKYHVDADGNPINEFCVAGNSDLTGVFCPDCKNTIEKKHANQEIKIEEANCYSDGYKLVYCTVCNYREVEIYAEKVDHAYTKQVTEIEPSVGATGLAYMHCQYCDLKGTEPEHKIVLDAIEGVHFFYEIVNVNGGSVIANSNTINVIISTKASGISLTGISLKLGYSTDVITFVSGEFCNAQFDAENVIITSPEKANAQQSVTIVANLKANETFYGEDEFAVLTFKVNDVVAEDAIIDLEVIAEGSNATNVEAEDVIEGVNFGTGAEAAIVRLGYLAGGTNITVADAQKIANIEGTLDENNNLLYNVAADIDKDGEITLADYGYLRQYLAGNLTYAELCAIGTSTEA